MMTENEIEKLAEEMVDHATAMGIAQQKIKDTAILSRKSQCPYCQSMKTKNAGGVEGMKVCKDCGTYYNKEFEFVFPVWARNPNAHFRRFICMSFNIRGEG